MRKIFADIEEPILFRTTNATVYEATLNSGSLWLRSDRYYREIEDQVRKDDGEGIDSGKTTIPLQFDLPGNSSIAISGDGLIGQEIVPHYILSMHGPSISVEQLHLFGGNTFGIRTISKLSTEILFRSSHLTKCVGYRFGAVYYQYATLARSLRSFGGPAIRLTDNPPVYLNPLITDVLRKLPVKPFIEQDEWRIVIFTKGYLSDDPEMPLRINVDPSHFYPYQQA
jgi:hypothetical protein